VASPSASPKSTGMVEVHNGLLEEQIRPLLAAEPSREWEQLLLRTTRALYTREVRVHGYWPFQLLFGIPPRLNLPGDNPLLSEIRGIAAGWCSCHIMEHRAGTGGRGVVGKGGER
jgi:hypothetical protein